MTTPLAPCAWNTPRIDSRSARSASTLSRSSLERGRGGSSFSGSSPSDSSSSSLIASVFLPQAERPERLGIFQTLGGPALLGPPADPLVHRPIVDLALVTTQRFDLRIDRIGDVDERIRFS